jgi:hypothetical protein
LIPIPVILGKTASWHYILTPNPNTIDSDPCHPSVYPVHFINFAAWMKTSGMMELNPGMPLIPFTGIPRTFCDGACTGDQTLMSK